MMGTTKAARWKPHLRWLIPLILIPATFQGFLAIGAAITPPGGPADRVESWIGLLMFLLAFVAPVVFAIMTIVGAVRVYRSGARYARKQQKIRARRAQEAADRIAKEGGPKCDAAAQLKENEIAALWWARFVRGEAPDSGTSHNLNLEAGERIYNQFRARYARYYGTGLVGQSGGVVAMGSPLFMAGALIGTAIRANKQARANQMAAQQWREVQYVDVFVTDRRFIVPLKGRLLSFYFNAVAAFFVELDAMTLTLDFGDRSEPMQIFSPAVSSASVAMIHQLQGIDGLRDNPALAPVRDVALSGAGNDSELTLE